MSWKRTLSSLLCVFGAILPAYGVSYRVTFDATWSAETHGDNYPQINPHFSTPVGTTHNDSVDFWEPGELASGGLETVAETGSLRLIIPEIQSAIDAGNAFGFVQGASFGAPASQFRVFEAVKEFPHFTYVAMIAPSPDWFVGADSVALRDENGWIPEVTVELLPYDAGTEDGETFFTGNPASNPIQPIRRLDTDSESVLFESAPFGVFRLELLPICDINGDGSCNVGDLSSNNGLYSAGDLLAGVPVVLGENSRLDLNGDNVIDTADLDFWLADAAEKNGFAEPYLRGDTNLNDHVGFGDFLGLSTSFGTGREWSEGNFNGDLETGFLDFLLLSRNYGLSIARQGELAAVPEPTTIWMPFLLVLIALSNRRISRNS